VSPSPLAGGVPAPALEDLGTRNKARLARIYLDGLASLTTTSPGDEALRAYLIARLAEIGAAEAEPAREAA
jgi:hypothetical protein